MNQPISHAQRTPTRCFAGSWIVAMIFGWNGAIAVDARAGATDKSESDTKQTSTTEKYSSDALDHVWTGLAAPDADTRNLARKRLKNLAGSALEPALAATKHSDSSVRAGAAVALGYFARNVPRVATAIGAMLDDPDPSVREAAITSLSRAKEHAASELARLYAVMEGDSFRLTRLAMRTAVSLRLEPEATALVIERVLKSPDTKRVAAAAESLAQLGKAASIIEPTLRQLVTHEDAEIRRNVVAALGAARTNPDLVVPLLIERLDDVDAEVSINAARSLGEFETQAENAVAELICRLQSDLPILVAVSASSLGRIGVPEAVEPLADVLAHPDPTVRATAAKSLGAIGVRNERAAKRLIMLARDSDATVRASALGALGPVGAEPSLAMPQLLQGMNDENAWVRAGAVHSLGFYPEAGTERLPQLQRALGDSDPWVQALAAGAIAELGADAAKQSATQLRNLINSDNGIVRIKAADALMRAGLFRPARDATDMAHRKANH